MGYRTVVMLNNDFAHEWQNDPELGKKIARATHRDGHDLGNHYGSVVQCVHADENTLAVLSNYDMLDVVAAQHYDRHRPDPLLMLLMDAAAKLGYDLVKREEK